MIVWLMLFLTSTKIFYTNSFSYSSSKRIYNSYNKKFNKFNENYSVKYNQNLYMMSDPDLASPKGMKGYYVRPSRAIEKGGGFYVPGLEGERIRIISGITFLFLIAINLSGNPLSTFDNSLIVSVFSGLNCCYIIKSENCLYCMIFFC